MIQLAISDTVAYMVLIGITLIFSAITIGRRSVTMSFISAFCWIGCSWAHLMLGEVGGALTLGLTWLYFGLGMIFLVIGIVLAIQFFLDQSKQRREQEIQPF